MRGSKYVGHCWNIVVIVRFLSNTNLVHFTNRHTTLCRHVQNLRVVFGSTWLEIGGFGFQFPNYKVLSHPFVSALTASAAQLIFCVLDKWYLTFHLVL